MHKIQEFRKQQGLTQAELAKRSGLSEISIRKYENGDRTPKIETIRKIAAALHVTIGELNPDWSQFAPKEIANDFQNGLPFDELGLLQDYRILNANGKNEARKRTEELTKIPEYRKEEE